MKVALGISLFIVTLSCSAARLSDEVKIFSHMCDASAATALTDDVFVVANDEDNLLRFYRWSQPGPPFLSHDLKPLISSKRKAPEADFEGAAKLGEHLFLITSHGRTAQGKPAPVRHRLLALQIQAAGTGWRVRSFGRPYTNLIEDLNAHPRYRQFQLRRAATQAPKSDGGLNIEALTDTPEGTLSIGFRSPLYQGNALIAAFSNPKEIVAGKAPQFGEPRLVNLQGLGLRGIGSVSGGYYLLAGPTSGEGESRLFFWKGDTSQPELLLRVELSGINPEGICFHDRHGADDFVLLSDDGTRKFGGKECKSLPPEQRQFRGLRLIP